MQCGRARALLKSLLCLLKIQCNASLDLLITMAALIFKILSLKFFLSLLSFCHQNESSESSEQNDTTQDILKKLKANQRNIF